MQEMQNDTSDLGPSFGAPTQAAVEGWIAAIKQEEALASVDHSVADVDQWEQLTSARMKSAAR